MRISIERSSAPCARELDISDFSAYAPFMSKDLGTKIRLLRRSLGKNQAEFGEMFSVTQGSVSRWENGAMPEPSALTTLAEMSNEDVRSFIAAGNANVSSAGPRLMVKGVVAAGVWREAFEWPADDWFTYTGGTHVTVDPKRRFGLRVEGDSMNMVYPHGTILDCVSAFDVETPQSGQRVVVIRKRLDDELESTVKEFHVDEGGKPWLLPRSTNPSHQRPIALNETDADVEETRIIALVVGSYRPE